MLSPRSKARGRNCYEKIEDKTLGLFGTIGSEDYS